MRLSKDKSELIYNEFLTLKGIPAGVFDYKLGNKSALDWVMDQYQVKMDKRSGIVNDPNDLDDDPSAGSGTVGLTQDALSGWWVR